MIKNNLAKKLAIAGVALGITSAIPHNSNASGSQLGIEGLRSQSGESYGFGFSFGTPYISIKGGILGTNGFTLERKNYLVPDNNAPGENLEVRTETHIPRLNTVFVGLGTEISLGERFALGLGAGVSRTSFGEAIKSKSFYKDGEKVGEAQDIFHHIYKDGSYLDANIKFWIGDFGFSIGEMILLDKSLKTKDIGIKNAPEKNDMFGGNLVRIGFNWRI